MTDAEKLVIKQYALGDKDLKDLCISIYRNNIGILGVRGSIEMKFMAEIDTSCPDYGLRARYRKELI